MLKARMRGVTAIGWLALAASMLPAAEAAMIETGVQGLKLVLLDKYGLGKAKAVYVAKNPGVGSHGAAGDPPGLSGTVEIFPLSDPTNRAVYDLPADWKVNKTNVAKYVNKTAGVGILGAKVTVQKPGLVQKAVAKNLGDGDSASGDQSATDLDLQAIADTDTIRVVLTIVNGNDGDTYVSCSDFGTLTIKLDNSNQPFKVLSRTSTAPSSCGVVPPTTTSTSTTTTSTTLPVCSGSEPGTVTGITAAHNDVRANASPTPVPALDPYCWSSTVASTAQAWADGCQYMHNPSLGSLGYGENIYAAAYTGSPPPGWNPPINAVEAWASEVADYDYATNTCSAVCGHYTQLVWRDTQAVGCGVKDCTTNSPFGPGFPNWTFVVCDYDPFGNVIGEWPY